MSRLLNLLLTALLACSFFDQGDRRIERKSSMNPLETRLAEMLKPQTPHSSYRFKNRAPANSEATAKAVEPVDAVIERCWLRASDCLTLAAAINNIRSNEAALEYAGRMCEFGSHCAAAKSFAVRLGYFEKALQYARIDCERSGEPCFDAGLYARAAGYDEEAIFWNVIGYCTKSIGDVPCNAVKARGYSENTFIDFLEIRLPRRNAEGKKIAVSVEQILFESQ